MKIFKPSLIFILSAYFLLSCQNDCGSPDVSDEQLNLIGNKLAAWGDDNCKVISINEKSIVWQGPNAGGCSPVYFEFKGATDPFDFEKSEDIVQKNLRDLINSSSCELSELISKANSIESDTAEDLIEQYLACLGTVEIIAGQFGIR